MNTINFTRGVPANESFPIAEVIDARDGRLQGARDGDAAVRTVARLPAAAPVAGRVAGRDGRSRAHRQRLAAADRVPLPAAAGAGRRRLHRVADLRPHAHLLRRHGAKVVGIPLEADGPNIEALERALDEGTCRSSSTSFPTSRIRPARRARAPSAGRSWSWPRGTASCSSKTRRTACCGIAAREEPTLYELAPDRTLHMSSFTKLIAPGVRTGFMIGEPALIGKLAKVAEDTYISPGYVAQGDHVRMVPARAAAAADRASEEALRAAARRLPRRPRHATCPTRKRRVPTAGSSSR